MKPNISPVIDSIKSLLCSQLRGVISVFQSVIGEQEALCFKALKAHFIMRLTS